MTDRSQSAPPRLPIEQVRALWNLFRKEAEKGSTIFHQAHAEELLALADEVIASRSDRAPTRDEIRYRWLRENGDKKIYMIQNWKPGDETGPLALAQGGALDALIDYELKNAAPQETSSSVNAPCPVVAAPNSNDTRKIT